VNARNAAVNGRKQKKTAPVFSVPVAKLSVLIKLVMGATVSAIPTLSISTTLLHTLNYTVLING
jgi:hypothetical protein